MRWRGLLAAGMLVTGCGDSTSPPQPIDIRLLDATKHETDLWVDVTYHVHNEGGAGAYRVQFLAAAKFPDSGTFLLGETDPVDVSSAYDETLTVRLMGDNPVLEAVVVLAHDPNSAVERETDRFTFDPF